MSPKEKAQELVHKFKCYTGRYYNSKRNTITSKQCALIAVDEILEVARDAYHEEVLGIHMIYWNKVKQEIGNL